ncbi:sigma factor [Streptomyces sp. NPDC019937]|uniref:RNA polymerase sigma factor n=1 Tax=Streptomyces sp. NPDC019937 TaxID=3154787 RepID=UPI0033F9B628
MTMRPAALDAAAYTRLYESEYPRLVGYARTLTGNPWTAGDLVAEAHFRVWRRLRTGESIDADAAPGELTSAVRGLAVASVNWGPPQQASLLEPLIRVLGELPQRWVTALWLAEAEDLPPEEAARRTRSTAEAAATLVERARGSLRHEFLRAQPGTPASAACGGHWDGMPGHVLGTDDPHQAERIAVHIDGCPDCRSRMERLVAADGRLAALTGPALLALYDRGTAPYLRPLAAAGGWAATGAAAAGAGTAGVGGPATVPIGGAHAAPANGPLVSGRRSMRHLMHGRVREAGPVAVAVAGAGVLFVAGAAVMTGLALTNGGAAEAGQPAAASAPSHKSADSSPSSGSSATDATDAASRTPDAPRANGKGEASRSRPSTKAPGPSDVPSSAVSPSRSTAPSSAPSDPSSSPSGKPTTPSKPTKSPNPSESGSTPTSKPTSEPTSKPSSPTQDPTSGGGGNGGGGTADPQGTPGQPDTPTSAATDDSQNCLSLLVRLCVND